MSKGLKEKLTTYLLNRKMKKMPRKKKIHNLRTAKTIGIIWMDDVLGSKEAAQKMAKQFRTEGKKVELMACGDGASTEYVTVNENDFSWLGQPKRKEIDEYAQIDFDILISLSTESNQAIEYITSLSRAQFKIGWESHENQHLDMQISTLIKPEPSFLAQQIEVYLDMINK